MAGGLRTHYPQGRSTDGAQSEDVESSDGSTGGGGTVQEPGGICEDERYRGIKEEKRREGGK